MIVVSSVWDHVDGATRKRVPGCQSFASFPWWRTILGELLCLEYVWASIPRFSARISVVSSAPEWVRCNFNHHIPSALCNIGSSQPSLSSGQTRSVPREQIWNTLVGLFDNPGTCGHLRSFTLKSKSDKQLLLQWKTRKIIRRRHKKSIKIQ